MAAITRGACGLAILFFVLQAIPPAIAQSQDLIVDICTTPNKYWNKQVLLKGHVVKVTPDPPGTNRGRYTLRDQSDKDLELATDDLPAQGKVYIIGGVVEQRKPGDNVPIVREITRQLAQPDSPVGAAVPAAQPPAAARPAAPAAKIPTSAEIEEAARAALRKELERSKAQPAAPAATAPAPVAPAPVATAPPAPPASSLLENPLAIAGIVVAVLAVIGVLFLMMRSKPTPAPYAAAPPSMPGAPMAAGTATEVASGMATLAAGRTEVVTRLGGELSVTEGPDRGRNYSIGRTTTTIGRSGQRKNDLDLSDTTVSREQAKVLYNNADRSFKLINESTTNPTRVNGTPVDAVVLNDGDRIEFGNTVVKFRRT